MKKKVNNPFISMNPVHLTAQGIKQINDSLEEKKLTPEQRNLLIRLKERLNIEARKLYPD
ncbi:hypothetical protein DRN74_03505 [Candidatus Micrarchaeota archaeon]|nr:MAG: hypothetical protein DRN74_03505 [Candidatus Micrarchaeota archaeon]